MRNIGISVYPSNANLEDNIKYVELAHSLGYKKIFICLLSIFTSNNVDAKEGFEEKFEEAKKIIALSTKLGFEVIADISSALLESLGASPSNLSYFKELGVRGIRLDEGYGGNEEALMTFNNHDIQIELNASVNNGYIDAVMSFYPDVHNLIACHNFYPKKRSGLSKEIFLESSMDYKKYNIRLSAFVNAKSASFGPWQVTEGLCTLEHHRDLDIKAQAKDLFYSDLIDDVIIANAFASKEELEALASIPRNILTLDVKVETDIIEAEEKIAFEELHFFRGDASIYSIRSTMPRLKFGKADIVAKNTRDIKRGDVFIENNNYSRYKGELHIALEDFPNEGNSNVIGRVQEDNIMLLDYIVPWKKFRLKKV